MMLVKHVSGKFRVFPNRSVDRAKEKLRAMGADPAEFTFTRICKTCRKVVAGFSHDYCSAACDAPFQRNVVQLNK